MSSGADASDCNSASYGSQSLTKIHHDDCDRERAKQWTYCIETLKRTIDCIYEICREDQSVIGCKEALMYLTNSVRDFDSLIDSINLEVSWDEEDSKPHSVAWEVRKAMSSPGRAIEGPNKKDADTLIDMLKLSPVVVKGVVENAESKLSAELSSAAEPLPVAESLPVVEPLPAANSLPPVGLLPAANPLPAAKVQSITELEISAETPPTVELSQNVSANEDVVMKEDAQKTTEETAQAIIDKGAGDDGWRVVKVRHKRHKGLKNEMNTPNEDGNNPVMDVYERLSKGIVRPTLPPRTTTLSEPIPAGRSCNNPRTAMDIPQTKASMAKIAYIRQLMWKKTQPELEEKFQKKRRREQIFNRKGNSIPALSAINFADPVAVAKSAAAFKSRKEIIVENEEERENMPLIDSASIKRYLLPCTRSEPPLSEIVLPDGMLADDVWRAMTEEEESLKQEELSLKKEIEEQEHMSIDDELERQVAAEATALEELDLENAEEENPKESDAREQVTSQPKTWDDCLGKWKQDMEKYKSVSWGEIVEREITRYRQPGEFAQKHEKLSSPSRKRKTETTTKKQEERQQKAEELRQQLLEQKAQRIKELLSKVDEVSCKRAELNKRKCEHLQNRMTRAEENRQKSIKEIVKRARDDDVKVMEVQFINTIENDNLRHDVMVRNRVWEQRMQSKASERARKNEEKAAKEAAAEERRKLAENQRVEKVREKLEKQGLLEANRLEQERDRAATNKKKNKQISERVEEKKACNIAESEMLKKKIEQKQEVTRRRHEESLTEVKQRAIELGSPRSVEPLSSSLDFSQTPSETSYAAFFNAPRGTSVIKKCERCNILIESDFHLIAHILGSSHMALSGLDYSDLTYDALKKDIVASVTEITTEAKRQHSLGGDSTLSGQSKLSNAMKKRRVRLRQEIQQRSKDWQTAVDVCREQQNEQSNGFIKNIDRPIRDIVKLVKGIVSTEEMDECCRAVIKDSFHGKTLPVSELHSLERALTELQRSLRQGAKQQHDYFVQRVMQSGLVDVLTVLGTCASNGETLVPSRTYCKVLNIMSELATVDSAILAHIFYTDRILCFVDSFRVKCKNVMAHFMENGSNTCNNDATLRSLVECIMVFHALTCIVNSVHKERFTTDVAGYGIQDDGARLRLLISLILSSGFNDVVAVLTKFSGITALLSWTLLLDTSALIVPLLCFVDFITNACEIGKESLPKSSQNAKPGDDAISSKMMSVVISSAKFALRNVVCRLYTMLCSGKVAFKNMTPEASVLPSDPKKRNEVSAVNVLATGLIRLWFIVKCDIAEVKQFVKDSEFSLRMVYIFKAIVAQGLKNIEANSSSQKTTLDYDRETNFLHLVITSIGYFANASANSKMLCVLGWQHSLLMQLCSFPLPYFSNSALIDVLVPTLIAICFRSKTAVELAQQVLSPRIFELYLQGALNEYTENYEQDDSGIFSKNWYEDAFKFFAQF